MFLGNLILYSTFVDRVVAKFSLSQLSGPKLREKFLRVIVNKQSYPGPVCVGCNVQCTVHFNTAFILYGQVWVCFWSVLIEYGNILSCSYMLNLNVKK